MYVRAESCSRETGALDILFQSLLLRHETLGYNENLR